MKLLKANALSLTLHISRSTIARWRKTGKLEEGIHYFQLSPNTILYNPELVYDWIANQQHPELHEQAIQNFLESLPSNDRPQRKPNKKAARTASGHGYAYK